jgi:hypothetical protein
METGGHEYYMKFNRGNHELRKITDEANDEYEVVFSGHYEKCIEKMNKIKAENFDYDYNL